MLAFMFIKDCVTFVKFIKFFFYPILKMANSFKTGFFPLKEFKKRLFSTDNYFCMMHFFKGFSTSKAGRNAKLASCV